jgi:AcrR family transcriptional regulator
VTLLEAEGEAGFSVRKVAARVGCDPMAVLYHFRNKEGLERAIVEWLAGQVALPDAARPWNQRLMALAIEYRGLARRHPHAFPLLLRFWAAGPVDQRLAEYGYACFAEAGHPDDAVADLCLGWYAAILGLAAADAGGLLRPPPDAARRLADLDAARFPVTSRLRSSLAHQGERAVFESFAARLVEAVRLPAGAARLDPIEALRRE